MKIYKTQAEVEKDIDIENGVLRVNDDVTFECPISIEANINAHNITADNIKAFDIDAADIKANNIDADDIEAMDINANDITVYNINADNITANNIKANDITVYNIDANNIKANDIKANDIKAMDINAHNINADNITANDISYYAFCLSYNGIKCSSITPRRTNHQEPICLDGELIITPKEQKISNPKEITIDGAVYVLKEEVKDE